MASSSQQSSVAAEMAAVSLASGLAPDLKKRIEMLSGHVARSGPDFEQNIKTKHAKNPQFSFLFGGEGSDYYQALLTSKRPAGSSPSAGSNASRTPASTGSVRTELSDLLRRWPEPSNPLKLGAELERRFIEIVAGLEHTPSKEAIQAGREWIEANRSVIDAIAASFMRRICVLQSCAHRLHLLFLLHDVLQTEAQRQETLRPMLSGFRPFLVWILRPAYQLALATCASNPSDEEPQKVLKLLSLWEDRGLLSSTDIVEMRLLVTAQQLPAIPAAAAAAANSLSGGGGGSTGALPPGLLEQVQAQVIAQQQARRLSQSQGGQSQENPYQVVSAAPPPPRTSAASPPPNYTGIWRPTSPTPTQQQPTTGYQLQQTPPSIQQLQPGAAVMQTLAAGATAQTPESIPVGVMASLLRQVSKRGKDLHTAFVPYKPLDPLYTPQSEPPTSAITARLMERLHEFYEVVGDCARPVPKPPPTAAIAPPPEQAAARSRSPRRSVEACD
mmetsp:Transcript_32226/g.68802  ORF Transcript_32226/g.68802 Transcript_32226/m.68802 type:complete len:500 (+) Transcript_32226:102-1601(+)